MEKLQILNSPEERQRRLHEIPDVHADPNLDSLFESDEDAAESDDSKKGSIHLLHRPCFNVSFSSCPCLMVNMVMYMQLGMQGQNILDLIEERGHQFSPKFGMVS